jgi:hypothetical protein
MDALMKNLWLLLTLVIPGMATYGTFRLLLVFDGGAISSSMFEKIDSSTLVTTCIVTALGMIQQAVAIAIEAGMAFVCARFRSGHEKYYSLFCERFQMAARGELNEQATRILGNFFTSLNVTIGQCLILSYLLWYENRDIRTSAAAQVIVALVLIGTVSVTFRLCNARSIISQLRGTAAGGSVNQALLTGAKQEGAYGNAGDAILHSKSR